MVKTLTKLKSSLKHNKVEDKDSLTVMFSNTNLEEVAPPQKAINPLQKQ